MKIIDGSISSVYLWGLIILLVALMFIRNILMKANNKTNLKIAKASIIGQEEIQADYAEVVDLSYGTLAILADGEGENKAGKIASLTAVQTIKNLFIKEGNKEQYIYLFKKVFQKANLEIIKRVEKDKGRASVISTVIVEDTLNYALVGDVVIGIFRNGQLVKLSEGHSLGEVVKKEYYKGKISKEEAIKAINNKRLIYYLGQETLEAMETPDIPIKLKDKDVIVIMSKGIYQGIRWIDLEDILSRKIDVDEASRRIVEVVKRNRKYSKSNGSIILMKYMANRRGI